jgi:hypothetical protein
LPYIAMLAYTGGAGEFYFLSAPLVRHRQAGNTCKSRGILPIERQNEEKRK